MLTRIIYIYINALYYIHRKINVPTFAATAATLGGPITGVKNKTQSGEKRKNTETKKKTTPQRSIYIYDVQQAGKESRKKNLT